MFLNLGCSHHKPNDIFNLKVSSKPDYMKKLTIDNRSFALPHCISSTAKLLGGTDSLKKLKNNNNNN